MAERNGQTANCGPDGKFELYELVGTGSFANVYRGVHKDTKQNVAVKVFGHKTGEMIDYTRMAGEIAFFRIIEHPFVIRFAFFELTRSSRIVGLEYSPHGSLLLMMNDNKMFPEDTVRVMMKQLLSAVAYLHDIYILHGDIKPENIIACQVEPEYIIKLSDFGLADVLINTDRPSKKSGTFYYMAPELHLNFPFDLSVDLFSVGVVMFELLYGKKPFPMYNNRDGHIGFLRKRAKLVRRAEKNAPPLSNWCFDLLERLLSYDKQERPTGLALRSHPFLNIMNEFIAYQNHYVKGCERVMSSFEHLRFLNYGQAFVDIQEAIFRLRIYSMSIKTDFGLHAYMANKLREYEAYAAHIEDQLDNNVYNGPTNMPLTDERLRCMLSSTAQMLTGYDMCLVGEMYANQHNLGLGRAKLTEGLNILFNSVHLEPIGERRNLLLVKMQVWVNLLETLNKQMNVPDAQGLPQEARR